MKKVTITGGGGFIGAYLAKEMVRQGWHVSIIDSCIRGDLSRLDDIRDIIEVHDIDIRNEYSVQKAVLGSDLVIHLAAINGTENFYNQPELVLDVGLRGMLSVVSACQKSDVPDLIVASSAEVYQTPSKIPTPEEIPLMLPDSINPRYSYGGSKIVSELIAFNYGREHFRRLQVFRPHNVYGPDMGWKHVVPQFISKIILSSKTDDGKKILNIQGNGKETRAFCYVDDIVDGILKMYNLGEHRSVYHIGNDHEIKMLDLADEIALSLNQKIEVITSEAAIGGTNRRCPDLSKMRLLGYSPKVNLNEGIKKTVDWYVENFDRNIENKLL
jgi:UDP-glucose 4-epimerase